VTALVAIGYVALMRRARAAAAQAGPEAARVTAEGSTV
jgi:hypothetical protein